MKQQKGFTLIELMGVVLILTIIGLIAVPSVINQIKGTQEDVNKVRRELFIAAASNYLSINSSSYPLVNGKVYCIRVTNIVDAGLLDKKNLVDPETNDSSDAAINKTLNLYFEVSVNNKSYEIDLKTYTNNTCVTK